MKNYLFWYKEKPKFTGNSADKKSALAFNKGLAQDIQTALLTSYPEIQNHTLLPVFAMVTADVPETVNLLELEDKLGLVAVFSDESIVLEHAIWF